MAIITPQTDVYLIKCPLEINDANQLTFANATAQYNYFQSLPKLMVGNDFTYQRKDGVIRVPELIDNLYGYNYVMYRNEGHGTKWFFAYITGMEYLNDAVTAVSIKTDVYQTWMFDLTYKRTFVEREHVNDDTAGLHTVPEDIETGEYVQNGRSSVINMSPRDFFTDHDGTRVTATQGLMVVFQVSYLLDNLHPDFASYYPGGYNGIFSGLYYFGCSSYADALAVIRAYDGDGHGGDIVAIFLAPASFFNGGYKGAITSGSSVYVYQPTMTLSLTGLCDNVTVAMPTSLGSYTPKNKKLLCYPWSYLYVTNHTGTDVDFRYEDFYNNTAGFRLGGAMGQGCSIRLSPINYKSPAGTDNGWYSFGLNAAKYPVCAWKSDYYTNWVTQNAINIGAGLATDVAKAGIGMAASSAFGNPIGAISSGVGLFGSIAGVIGQTYAAQKHPDYANGNVNGSDSLVGSGKYISMFKMCVKPEYAKIADDFLSMFGYKVNEVKVPNVTGRRNWNFVKTIGCYIEADIPQEDLQEIKSMFDKGITFWHNPSTFMDYSQNNDII